MGGWVWQHGGWPCRLTPTVTGIESRLHCFWVEFVCSPRVLCFHLVFQVPPQSAVCTQPSGLYCLT